MFLELDAPWSRWRMPMSCWMRQLHGCCHASRALASTAMLRAVVLECRMTIPSIALKVARPSLTVIYHGMVVDVVAPARAVIAYRRSEGMVDRSRCAGTACIHTRYPSADFCFQTPAVVSDSTVCTTAARHADGKRQCRQSTAAVEYRGSTPASVNHRLPTSFPCHGPALVRRRPFV